MWRPRHLERRETCTPIWLEQVDAINFLLRWSYAGRRITPVYAVYQDGELLGTTTQTSLAVSGLLGGRQARFDVLALSRLDAAATDFSAWLYRAPTGTRLGLSWPAVDLAANPDFYGYVLYWSTDGSDPTEELAVLVGAETISYVTDELADGTVYRFALALRDIHGNESALGAIATGTVNTLPEPASDLAVVYDQATRTATITATAPDAQDADLAAWHLYSNYLAGHGLLAEVRFEEPLATAQPDAALSFTVGGLFAGSWRFALRAVDRTGLESDYETVQLNLEASGGELLQTPDQPARPVDLDAVAIAGGRIRVTVTLATDAGVDEVRIYRDGAYDGAVETTPGQAVYRFETDALVHGETYTFTATAAAGEAESALSEEAAATADALAPAGETTLTVELVS